LADQRLKWARQIRQQMRRTPGLLAAPLASSSFAAVPTIELSDETIRAHLLDVVSISIPAAELYSDVSRRASLPQDAIIAMAVALERAGHNDLAARLTLEFGAESTLIWQVGVAGSLPRRSRGLIG
jgi:hypothetical protein